MGALPYEGSCDAVIRMPERVVRGMPLSGDAAPDPRWVITAMVPEPLPVDYEAAVERALRPSTRARSRRSCWREPCWWKPTRPSILACSRGASTLRNRLVRLSRGASRRPSHPRRRLAGTRRPATGTEGVQRSPGGDRPPVADRSRDQEIARQLLDAVKEQREHRLVAEAVADAMAPFCSNLVVDSEAGL